jgi:hypothetical protein
MNYKLVNVKRRCGHTESVQIVDDGRDGLRMQRKARKDCSSCIRAAEGNGVKKGAESYYLPIGTRLVMVKTKSGWEGTADIPPLAGDVSHGPCGLMGLGKALCRKLLSIQANGV